MLHGLLFILLLVIVFIAVVALIVVRTVFNTIHKVRDAARSAMGMDTESKGSNAGERYNNGSARGGNATQGRRTRTTSGETIIDTRNPEHANRKIFAKDEGEYVDFREE